MAEMLILIKANLKKLQFGALTELDEQEVKEIEDDSSSENED